MEEETCKSGKRGMNKHNVLYALPFRYKFAELYLLN